MKDSLIVPRDPRFYAALRDCGITALGTELAAFIWFTAPHLFAVAARSQMKTAEIPGFVALVLGSFASDLLRAEEQDRQERQRPPKKKGKR